MGVCARTITTALLVVTVLLMPGRVLGQGIPVFDFQLILQYVELILKTTATLQKLGEQYETLTRMSRGLPGMAKFRIPAIVSPAHDVGRYPYGGPLLAALNSGDPNATKYYDVVRTLTRDVSVLAQLPPDVRRALHAAYATIEVLDSTNHEAINQVGSTRVYNRTIGTQIDSLQDVITSPDPALHQMTSVLDTLAAAALVGARQDTAAAQLEANLVSVRIAKAKADRDAHVAHLSMMLTRLRDRGATANALVRGADVLATWSQP